MTGFEQSVLYQEYQHKLQLLNPGLTSFAPSAHYAQPPPPGYQTGAAMGYYSNGFVQAGGNQTGLSLSGVLGGIVSGLETVFHVPPPGSLAPVSATTPGTVANQHPVLTGAGKASGTAGRIAGVAAGTAIAGGIVGELAPGLVGLGGRHARYAPAGTKGYHMIKRGPHAGLWTKNRHRNVANIRALRRALSRAHGFERVARKVCHFVRPGGGRGRAIFKRRRRKC